MGSVCYSDFLHLFAGLPHLDLPFAFIITHGGRREVKMRKPRSHSSCEWRSGCKRGGAIVYELSLKVNTTDNRKGEGLGMRQTM